MLSVSVAAESTALVTLAAYKADQGITATTDDTYHTGLIASASLAIAKACRRPHFGRETVVQTERLTCYRLCIILDRDIAVSVSSVVVDGVTLDTDEYEADGALLYRLRDDTRECWAPGKIVITYAAGYSLPNGAPADLARACVLTMSAWSAARGRDPLLRSQTHEDTGAESYLDPRDGAEVIPPQAVALLSNYVRSVV